jgi:hypothetical protein
VNETILNLDCEKRGFGEVIFFEPLKVKKLPARQIYKYKIILD